MSIIDQVFANQPSNFVQFVKYAIGGGIATCVHMIFFHLAAWKLYFALQADDWFVRLLNLPIHELDDTSRSRNSMKANAVAFLVANLVAYLINIYWVFVPGRYHWMIEIALFYLVSAVAMVIGTSIMGFLIRRFGILTTYAFGSNVFAALRLITPCENSSFSPVKNTAASITAYFCRTTTGQREPLEAHTPG